MNAGDPPPDQSDPLVVDHRDLPDCLADQATTQPVMLIEEIVKPGHLARDNTPDHQPVTGLETLPHTPTATIPT